MTVAHDATRHPPCRSRRRRRFSASRVPPPASCGATGSTRAARRGRWRSRSAINCRKCWRGCWPGATSRSTRCADFLDPTIRKLMPDPHTVTRDGDRREAHRGRGDARREGRDLRRLRRRRRDLGGAAGLASAALRARSADPHSRPHFRGLRPQCRGDPRCSRDKGATLLVTVDCGTTSLEPLAEARTARHVGGRDRSSPMRRRIARRRCAGQSEPARRSLRPRPSRRGRPRVGDAGRGQSRTAPARVLDRRTAGARSARTCCITSRSAPSPTSRR